MTSKYRNAIESIAPTFLDHAKPIFPKAFKTYNSQEVGRWIKKIVNMVSGNLRGSRRNLNLILTLEFSEQTEIKLGK